MKGTRTEFISCAIIDLIAKLIYLFVLVKSRSYLVIISTATQITIKVPPIRTFRREIVTETKYVIMELFVLTCSRVRP